MTFRSAYIGFVSLIVGLFFAFQISAAAHAIEHGENPHEHDGVSCVVTTLAENDQGVLPVEPELVALSMPVDFTWIDIFKPIQVQTYHTRAPPPRGPPTIIQ